MEKTFAILGGDKRQLALLHQLKEIGYNVYLYGFKSEETEENLNSALSLSKFIVFPVPISKNEKDLYAPFSTKVITLGEIIKNKNLKNKIIFTPGLSENEINYPAPKKENKIFKYCTEEFLVENAKLTAKATLKIIRENLKEDLKNKKTLICGFGRLGTALCKILKSEFLDLTVSARKELDFKKIEKLSLKHIKTSEIRESSNYDLIINTIPALIFDEFTLKTTAKNSLLIDLASNPGGVDKIAANKLKINHIHALGLPGKFFPDESAKIIKEKILKNIEEKKPVGKTRNI